MKRTKIDLSDLYCLVSSAGHAFPQLFAEVCLLLWPVIAQTLPYRVTQSSVFIKQQRHAAICRAPSFLFGLFLSFHNDCDHFRSGQERIGIWPNYKVE